MTLVQDTFSEVWGRYFSCSIVDLFSNIVIIENVNDNQYQNILFCAYREMLTCVRVSCC